MHDCILDVSVDSCFYDVAPFFFKLNYVWNRKHYVERNNHCLNRREEGGAAADLTRGPQPPAVVWQEERSKQSLRGQAPEALFQTPIAGDINKYIAVRGVQDEAIDF